MIPRLSNRAPRMRAVRGHLGEPGLESLAAEFALLAQRRSKAIHQMEILDHQRAAAAASFAKLQKRIAWLFACMEAYAPEPPVAVAAVPEPQPPQQHSTHRPLKPVTPAHADAMAAIGRKWVAAGQSHPDHPVRPRFSRRP